MEIVRATLFELSRGRLQSAARVILDRMLPGLDGLRIMVHRRFVMEDPQPELSSARRTALTHVRTTVPERKRTSALARKNDQPRPADSRTTAALIKDAFADSMDVLQAHLELAVLEVREDARAAVSVASAFGVSAALTVLGAGFLLAAAAFGIALYLPAWAACLIVAGVALVVASVAFLVGRRTLNTHDFTPEHTIASLQENAEWTAGNKS